MPAQRKIFRIEEIMQAEHAAHDQVAPDDAACPSDIVAELRALRALMEQHLPGLAQKRAAPDAPATLGDARAFLPMATVAAPGDPCNRRDPP